MRLKLILLTAALSLITGAAVADNRSTAVAGVTYQLDTAFDVARAAVGQASSVSANEIASNASWLQWHDDIDSAPVQLVASFKGSFQFGRSALHHASQGERVGFDSDDTLELKLLGMPRLLITGLRVGAKLSF